MSEINMQQRAFVIMPFGIKPDGAGNNIDFNAIYGDLIKPALEKVGLFVFRADQELRAGDIRSDMFQELLLADFVLADVTLDNPNVWYELGVRHALRARDVMLISGGRVMAFDVYTDRKLRYTVKDGKPNPETLEEDRNRISDMAEETLHSWQGRKVSPVYNLMPNLQEPDWKSLRMACVNEIWSVHNEWEKKLKLAGKKGLAGDMLILADEAPISALKDEAWLMAGKVLRDNQHFKYALELYEKVPTVNSKNLVALQGKGVCLERLANEKVPGFSFDRARDHIVNIINEFPNDSESLGLLGRLDKDAWRSTWKDLPPDKRISEARNQDALLRVAIDSYLRAFQLNPSNYFPGINALTLINLYSYLTEDDCYSAITDMLGGAVKFAATSAFSNNPDYWAIATMAEIEVLVGTKETTIKSYKNAIAKSNKDWFALNSSLSQLKLLESIGFQSERVSAAINLISSHLTANKKDELETKTLPRKVFLFSGHMIDKPDRESPRFPNNPHAIENAKKLIHENLMLLGAGPDDIALTQGACGGDLLFSQACFELGVSVRWLQPFNEPEFIQRSVIQVDHSWRAIYRDAKAKLQIPIRSALEELGPPPKYTDEDYPFERCNLWLLYTALAYGEEKVEFICLWDGQEGDGPGSTSHMYNEVSKRTGAVTWIDTHKL
jgi:tetratricopeptide (TPR) repeat protein